MKIKNIIIGLIFWQIVLIGMCLLVAFKGEPVLGITCIATDLFFIGVNLNTLRRIKKGDKDA